MRYFQNCYAFFFILFLLQEKKISEEKNFFAKLNDLLQAIKCPIDLIKCIKYHHLLTRSSNASNTTTF